MELVQSRRGTLEHMEYVSDSRVQLRYEMPLSELIVDFYDELKSRTQGYGSLDYAFSGYRPADVVKVDLLVGGQPVDALSIIVHREKAQSMGRNLVDRLQDVIPRQLFEVPIQAAIGNKVIARETIRALRKNVLAKCYGGDVTRKRKLLEKQKEGKARMKRVGSVEIPPEAFMAVLKLES
jgi:GTP-binding protein LepA